MSHRPPRLLDQVRIAIRRRHFSPRTEKSYVGWIRRFVSVPTPQDREQGRRAPPGAASTLPTIADRDPEVLLDPS